MAYQKSMYVGSKAEMAVIDLLESHGIVCSKSIGKNSFYDIEVELDNQYLFIEVKYDKMSDVTKNLALEYFNPKSEKLSGISVTQSDYWIFAFEKPLQLWISSIDEIKNYVGQNPPMKVVDIAGDRNASLYLYKRDKLISSIFTRIDNMNKDDLIHMFNSYIRIRNENYAREKLGVK